MKEHLHTQITAGKQLADRLVFALAELPPSERELLAEELIAGERLGRGRILVVEAIENGLLCGAMAGWILPGRSATVWPPHVISNPPAQILDSLQRTLAEQLSAAGVLHAQAMVPADADRAAENLARCGFEWAADLLYLVCGKESFSTLTSELPFRLVPIANGDITELIAVVDATYDETLDCPALNGLRPTSEVLAGYCATGDYRPEWWYVVEIGNQPVGCLLLADHPQAGQMELVYFGLTPAARGQGFGEMLVRYSQSLALAAGREQLVLAVDARNKPAIDAYFRCGFEEWGRRSVWLRCMPR